MLSLFFRNFLFTILQPGIVAGLIPYLILGGHHVIAVFEQSFGFRHYVSLLVFIIGFIILLTCIIGFAVHGRGTLSPADPTKKLVVQGLYRYSRNPMYVGVMLMLVGESVLFQSGTLWLYTGGIFIMFNIFIRYIEEPRLIRDFGSEYTDYRKRVKRWL